MYITSLSLKNIRCFADIHTIDLSKKISLLVGHNNSGKSTILKSIYQLQRPTILASDVSVQPYNDLNSQAEVSISLFPRKEYYEFNNFPKNPYTKQNIENVKIIISINKRTNANTEFSNRIRMQNKQYSNELFEIDFDPYPENSDKNLIYPFFSNRKVDFYSKSNTVAERKTVDGKLTNLNSKIDYLTNPQKPVFERYKQACLDILGFYVVTDQDEEGHFVALSVGDNNSIPLMSMGDGVSNILGLIVDLCTAEDKIFIIEEPENDIHPKALKALLKLIEDHSDSNQFIISTHSNIVVKYLGAVPESKVFQIVSETDYTAPVIIPKSRIEEVSDLPEERIKLLEDLGYDAFDYLIWKGWLFLEESSAETIINDVLIPEFASGLKNKLRTFSAGGFDGIEQKFENFHKLFVFVHRDSLYKDRAWVLIDGGEKEKESIEKLKARFTSWNANHFRQLSEHNFEEYYPSQFADDVRNLNDESQYSGNSKEKDKQKKQYKKNLLLKVKAWYTAYPDEAKDEFEQSASEVINILREIERVLA